MSRILSGPNIGEYKEGGGDKPFFGRVDIESFYINTSTKKKVVDAIRKYLKQLKKETTSALNYINKVKAKK